MSHQTVNELSDNINKIVAATVVNDKQGLITILKKNGLVVSATTSDADLIGVTYLGAARSQRLRNDLVARFIFLRILLMAYLAIPFRLYCGFIFMP